MEEEENGGRKGDKKEKRGERRGGERKRKEEEEGRRRDHLDLLLLWELDLFPERMNLSAYIKWSLSWFLSLGKYP